MLNPEYAHVCTFCLGVACPWLQNHTHWAAFIAMLPVSQRGLHPWTWPPPQAKENECRQLNQFCYVCDDCFEFNHHRCDKRWLWFNCVIACLSTLATHPATTL